jgi:NAD-dependent SIR2 family protein deacetylase
LKNLDGYQLPPECASVEMYLLQNIENIVARADYVESSKLKNAFHNTTEEFARVSPKTAKIRQKLVRILTDNVDKLHKNIIYVH